jgi:hypothetical protein
VKSGSGAGFSRITSSKEGGNIMTINWTQDEHGNLDWTHEGWSVRIWALENSGLFRDKGVNRIDVNRLASWPGAAKTKLTFMMKALVWRAWSV